MTVVRSFKPNVACNVVVCQSWVKKSHVEVGWQSKPTKAHVPPPPFTVCEKSSYV